MNIPRCNDGPITAHDFDTLVASPRMGMGYLFPCLRACTRCGVLELVIADGRAVYFLPLASMSENESDPQS